MIYEILFKRGEPVLFHNPDAYHAIEPQRENYSSDGEDYFHEDIDEFESLYESEIDADHEFVHDFYLGLSLLLVCRQIYHEAAGVFCGDNTFVFSQVLRRHDNNSTRHHDRDAYHQLVYASKWLSSIGNQFGMLKKVHIDLEVLCLCQPWRYRSDILPLLRVLWRSKSKKFPVVFTCTGRRLPRVCCHFEKKYDASCENRSERFQCDCFERDWKGRSESAKVRIF